MDLVVLCDFDGTITMVDTTACILGRFAAGDWKALDRQFELGGITLEECLRREFKLVRASEDEMLESLKEAITMRPQFDKLMQYCKSNSIPLTIVSAGLDFVIEHFLRLNGWNESVAVYAATTQITAHGVEFTFPSLQDKSSANFKQDLVRQHKRQGKTVIYIGDGTGDFDAAEEADHVFAVRDSRLAILCRKHQVHFSPITAFQDVVDHLRTVREPE